jgi:hypothetical protein
MYQTVLAELRKAYDLSAVDRDGRTISAWKQRERRAFFELLNLEEKTTLLEIGAGPGKDSTPKRYFSFYPDDEMQDIMAGYFDIHDFKIITLPDSANPKTHFQRLILRKV